VGSDERRKGTNLVPDESAARLAVARPCLCVAFPEARNETRTRDPFLTMCERPFSPSFGLVHLRDTEPNPASRIFVPIPRDPVQCYQSATKASSRKGRGDLPRIGVTQCQQVSFEKVLAGQSVNDILLRGNYW
jgi:hypothetical protein